MKYYRLRHKNNQVAIFNTKTGQQVSQWWEKINASYLLKNKSSYYGAKNKDGKWAIFHIDNPDQPISQWHNQIYRYGGLLQGQSEYYIALDQEEKEAIFHKDNPHEPISQWWNRVFVNGLLQGESDYYMVFDPAKQLAIFHKDNPYDPVSQWWDGMYWNGLLNNKSVYYIAQDNDDKHAIFHKDNPYEPVSQWHNYIYSLGLINGISHYYGTVQKNNSTIQIYHLHDILEPLYEFDIPCKGLLLYFDDKIAIYLDNEDLIMYDAINMQHFTISPLSQDMQDIISDIYDNTEVWDYNGTVISNELIHKYINENFIPIVFTADAPYPCYLYTLDGKFVKKFKSAEDIIQYMQKEIDKTRSKYQCEIMRLY